MKKNILCFALDESENLKHVDKVETGLNCNCICPSCKSVLIAKNKGEKKVHHFAHYKELGCSLGFETSLHLLAKDIISNAKSINLPLIEEGKNGIPRITSFSFIINKVFIEPYSPDFIPDIQLFDEENNQLFVEIFVTHKIDEIKKGKIIQRGIKTIEIDLSQFQGSFTKEEVERVLIKYIEMKKWIFHPDRIQIGNTSYQPELNLFMESEGKSIFVLWKDNKIIRDGFFRNLVTGWIVYIKKDPWKKFLNYGKVYGFLSKDNISTNNREINYVNYPQWEYITSLAQSI